MSELPCCDHIFSNSNAQCTDQARYYALPLSYRLVAPSTGANACMAHLAQVIDRLGTDRQGGEYVPILVRRLPDE